MSPIVHSLDASPPCRAVLLTAKALGVDLDIVKCDLFELQHLTTEYIKLNPQHTIPTLIDGDLVLPNSHAINIYLVEKYGKDDSLYPKDVTKRAIVNHRLFFDEGTAFESVARAVRLFIFARKPIPEENKKKAQEVYKLVEIFLNNQEWIAGQNLTIADFHFITTITSMMLFFPLNKEDYPNILAWMARCQALPYYEINQKGLNDIRVLLSEL